MVLFARLNSCMFVPYRQVILWSQGLLHLVWIFHLSCPSFLVSEWKAKLKSIALRPASYKFNKVSSACTVYLKLPFPQCNQFRQAVSSKFCYVGCTHISIGKREANRVAKLRQLRKGRPTKAELSLRWWHQQDNYLSFSTIVLCVCKDKPSALVEEHCFISKWQPCLNFPFVSRFLHRKALGYVFKPCKVRNAHQNLGDRLFKKLRRRTVQFRRKPVCMQLKTAWGIISSLASLTRQSYLAAKLIRSNAVSPDEVYALFRMAGNLEEPMRSRVRTTIQSAMKFRKLSVPRSNKPFRCPFMSHPTFKTNLSRFLRNVIVKQKQFAIPFHLPTHKPMEGKHPRISDRLFNFKHWLRKFQPGQPMTCECEDLKRIHPRIHLQDGHVASSASLFGWPRDIATMLSFHVQSGFYESKRRMLAQYSDLYRSWLLHHGLPVTSLAEFQQFFEAEWDQHFKYCKAEQLITAQAVNFVRQTLGHKLVFHCADKESGHCMCFCPLLYCNTMLATWSDPHVFEEVCDTPNNVSNSFRYLLPPGIQKRYAWGFDWKAPLPYGYGFLKRKKAFRVARTIISYSHTVGQQLLKTLAIFLQEALAATWPTTFGLDKTPVIWKRIHAFLQDQNNFCLTVNDDLVGFFNAVPQDRILTAVDQLLLEFHARFCMDKPFNLCSVSIDRQLPSGEDKTFLGRFKPIKGLRIRTVWLADVRSLIQFSFNTGIFTAMNRLWRQVRGTCVGNQISPILSSIAVSLCELNWQRSFSSWWTTHKLTICFVRYVDNRFCFIPEELMNDQPVKVLRSPHFYGEPVILEDVEDSQLILGFKVNVNAGTSNFVLNPAKWTIRSCKSAGSVQYKLSGLRSKASLIRQYAFPNSSKTSALQALANLYIQNGYDAQVIQAICR